MAGVRELYLVLRARNETRAAFRQVSRDVRALPDERLMRTQLARARQAEETIVRRQRRLQTRVESYGPGGKESLRNMERMNELQNQLTRKREQEQALYRQQRATQVQLKDLETIRLRQAQQAQRAIVGGKRPRVPMYRSFTEEEIKARVENINQQITNAKRLSEAQTRGFAQNAKEVSDLNVRHQRLAVSQRLATQEIMNADDEFARYSEQLRIAQSRTAGLSQALEQLPNERLAVMASSVGHLGRSMATVGVIGAGAFALMGRSAMQFNEQATLAATQTSGSITENTTKIENSVLGMMTKFPAASEDMTKGMYDILSSTDANVEGATKMMNAFNMAAVGGMAPLNDVVNAGITLMNDFGLKAGDAESAMNKMMATVRFGRTNVLQYTSSLNQMVPAFQTTGQSIDEMNASFAALTRLMPSQRMAATSLARFVEQLFRERKGFEDLGVSVTDANDKLLPLHTIFQRLSHSNSDLIVKLRAGTLTVQEFNKAIGGSQGTIQGARAMALLILNGDLLDEMYKKVTSDHHELARSFNALQKTPANQWKVFTNTLKATAIVIGQGVVPAFEMIGKVLVPAVNAFRSLPRGAQQAFGAITALGLVFVAIGGSLLMFVGGIVSLIVNLRMLKTELFEAATGMSIFGRSAKVAGVGAIYAADGVTVLNAEAGILNRRMALILGTVAALSVAIPVVAKYTGGWSTALEGVGTWAGYLVALPVAAHFGLWIANLARVRLGMEKWNRNTDVAAASGNKLRAASRVTFTKIMEWAGNAGLAVMGLRGRWGKLLERITGGRIGQVLGRAFGGLREGGVIGRVLGPLGRLGSVAGRVLSPLGRLGGIFGRVGTTAGRVARPVSRLFGIFRSGGLLRGVFLGGAATGLGTIAALGAVATIATWKISKGFESAQKTMLDAENRVVNWKDKTIKSVAEVIRAQQKLGMSAKESLDAFRKRYGEGLQAGDLYVSAMDYLAGRGRTHLREVTQKLLGTPRATGRLNDVEALNAAQRLVNLRARASTIAPGPASIKAWNDIIIAEAMYTRRTSKDQRDLIQMMNLTPTMVVPVFQRMYNRMTLLERRALLNPTNTRLAQQAAKARADLQARAPASMLDAFDKAYQATEHLTVTQVRKIARHVYDLRKEYEKAPTDMSKFKTWWAAKIAMDAQFSQMDAQLAADLTEAWDKVATPKISNQAALAMARQVETLRARAEKTRTLPDAAAYEKLYKKYTTQASADQIDMNQIILADNQKTTILTNAEFLKRANYVEGLRKAAEASVKHHTANAWAINLKYQKELSRLNKDASSEQQAAWDALHQAEDKKLKDSVDKAKATLNNLTQAFVSKYNEIKQANESAMGGLFESPFMQSTAQQLRAQWGITAGPEQLVQSMQSRVGAFEKFQGSLGRLARRGAPREMIDQIRQMGPSAQQNIDQVMRMTPGQWRRFVALYQKGQQDIKTATDAQMQSQIKQWFQYGKAVGQAIITGVSDQDVRMQNAMRKLVLQLFPGITTKAGVTTATTDYAGAGAGAMTQRMFELPGANAGLLKPGNLDLLHRKVARVGNMIATVKSFSIGTDAGETLLPSVIGGKVVSQAAAIRQFKRTGQNLGTFTGPEAADAYAERLHRQQEQYYGNNYTYNIYTDKNGAASLPTTLRKLHMKDKNRRGPRAR